MKPRTKRRASRRRVSLDRTIVLDAGALIGIEKNTERMRALLEAPGRLGVGVRFVVPVGPLGQAWRGGPRQVRLTRFLAQPEVETWALTEPMAKAAGILCAETKSEDLADATVILCARQSHAVSIVTSDIGDLRRLDSKVVLIEA